MKKVMEVILVTALLVGCNESSETNTGNLNEGNPDLSPSPVGQAYEDLWYLTASNPGAGILVMEVNATANRQCGKHFDLKKLIVWDRFNEALAKDTSKEVEARKEIIAQMVSDICAQA